MARAVQTETAIPDRRAALMATVLAETLEGQTDTAVAARHGISARSIKRWRTQEREGRLPEVSAELAKYKAHADEAVKRQAENTLKGVLRFLQDATEKGDRTDPKMIEAMTRAGEFLVDTLAMHKMLNVQGARATQTNREANRSVDAEAGSSGSGLSH